MLGIGVSLRHLRGTTAAVDAYKVAGFKPDLVFDFEQEYYRTGGTQTTFDSAITHSRSGNATMVDSDGLLKWAPHNLFNYSDGSQAQLLGTDTTDAATPIEGFANSLYFDGDGTLSLKYWSGIPGGVLLTLSVYVELDSGAEPTFPSQAGAPFAFVVGGASPSYVSGYNVTHVSGNIYQVSATMISGFSGSAGIIQHTNQTLPFKGTRWQCYRSDLGGMVNNPDRGDIYVPTTSAARYLARRGHHVYNGAEWVNEGALVEPTSAVQLLHTTDALVTQSHTVTAEPHTLHFTGTGTVTLFGAYIGSLVGTGTGEENRVSLTFTPTAASLTLTVSGTVSDAQLEVGSVPTSYIPNLAASGTVTRAADTLTVPSANLPWSSDAVSIQMEGCATGDTLTTTRWYLNANNYITQEINTSDFTFEQANAGTVDAVTGGSFTSGVNTAFNIASRHGSTFINGAVDGTALTVDTTPTALPDLSSSDLNLAYSGGPMILKMVRIWADDLGDSGIAEASA